VDTLLGWNDTLAISDTGTLYAEVNMLQFSKSSSTYSGYYHSPPNFYWTTELVDGKWYTSTYPYNRSDRLLLYPIRRALADTATACPTSFQPTMFVQLTNENQPQLVLHENLRLGEMDSTDMAFVPNNGYPNCYRLSQLASFDYTQILTPSTCPDSVWIFCARPVEPLPGSII